jgi:hypothetical protein
MVGVKPIDKDERKINAATPSFRNCSTLCLNLGQSLPIGHRERQRVFAVSNSFIATTSAGAFEELRPAARPFPRHVFTFKPHELP